MDPALENAVAFARRGFYVFPILPGLKVPYKDFAWKELSTNDPDKVAAAAKHPKYKNCNWALDCGKSDLTVTDIDIKPEKGIDGREALNNYPELSDAGIIVKTPTDGRHLYHKHAAPTTASKLGPGLDTRGHGGYVLLPGSKNGTGKSYELIKDNPLTPLPISIQHKLTTDTTKKPDRKEPACEFDIPHNIDAATHYLKETAPAAIEGAGGDSTTYKVACRVRDFGISQPECLSLLLEHWNDTKAIPPWHPDELITKVRSAYRYAKDKPGNATAEAVFGDPLAKALNEDGKDSVEENPKWIDAGTLASQPITVNWVVPGYIELDTVNIWFGSYAQFKSFLAVDLALAVTSGATWARGHKPCEPSGVLYIQGEGHGGTRRRLRAAAQQRHLDLKGPAGQRLKFSSTALPLGSIEAAVHVVKSARAFAEAEPDVGMPRLIIIDTLATNFSGGGGDENSTKDMGEFYRNIEAIRTQLGCAILIVHHSGLSDKERSRGSSVLESSATSVFKVQRESKDSMSVCLHQPPKMKDAEPPQDTWFEAKRMVIGMDEDGVPITSLAIQYTEEHIPVVSPKQLGENQQFFLDTLADKALNRSKLLEEFRAFKGKAYKRQSFHAALTTLIERKLLLEENGVVKSVFQTPVKNVKKRQN